MGFKVDVFTSGKEGWNNAGERRYDLDPSHDPNSLQIFNGDIKQCIDTIKFNKRILVLGKDESTEEKKYSTYKKHKGKLLRIKDFKAFDDWDNLYKYNGNDLRRLAKKLGVDSPRRKEHLIEAIVRAKLGKKLLYGENKLENEDNNRYTLNRNKDSEVKTMSDDKNKLEGEKTKTKKSEKEKRALKSIKKLFEFKPVIPADFKFDREEANER